MSQTTWSWIALAAWVILTYPVWSPRCARLRREQQEHVLAPSTGGRVSRNNSAWVQDYPYPECFEEDDMSEPDEHMDEFDEDFYGGPVDPQCDHENISIEEDSAGREYRVCDDCGSYWPVKR